MGFRPHHRTRKVNSYLPVVPVKAYIKAKTVALLIAGSAILLISCQADKYGDSVDPETVITQRIDSIIVLNSANGHKTYRMSTPLMERYEMAKEPYQEFRRGIEVEKYKDTTGVVEWSIKADYAIFWENQKLWEGKGNVVGVNADGMILETQQLFWNQKTKKIYSNVDTKVTQNGNPTIGVGFEADENFEYFVFRRARGKVTVDVEPTRPDSTATAAPEAEPADNAGAAAKPSPSVQPIKKPVAPVRRVTPSRPKPQSDSPAEKKLPASRTRPTR